VYSIKRRDKARDRRRYKKVERRKEEELSYQSENSGERSGTEGWNVY